MFKKNAILVRNRLWIIVSMLGSRGVPSLQCFSNSERAFVNDTRIVKIYAMVKWPRMFRNVQSISTCFDISDMFTIVYNSCLSRQLHYTYKWKTEVLTMPLALHQLRANTKQGVALLKVKAWNNESTSQIHQTGDH